MSDVLTRICNTKKDHITQKKHAVSLDDLKSQIKDAPAPKGFLRALQNTAQAENIALIAEIKKASPSKGLIREPFNYMDIAQSYQRAGASCLSVLTDEPYFQGHDTYLTQVGTVSTCPLLRKDFMIDAYQIYESRAIGADCILLIAAALNDPQMTMLYDLSMELGMDVLVEVHDESELERALAISPHMIGVNSRNLKTLEVDTNTAHRLIARMPASIFKIAESGIYSHEDIQALKTSGADGFLVGESLMKQENIESATKKLLGTN